MAIRINLLPKSYQPPRQIGAKEFVIAGAVALTLFGGGAFYVSTWTGIGKMEQEIVVKGAQLQQVKAKLADADAIKVREQKVADSEGDLKLLTGREWSPFLADLTEMTPQRLTWTALRIETDHVQLEGNAGGLIDLAQFFGGLVNHPTVEFVALRYVNEHGIPVTMTIKGRDGSVNMAGLNGPGATAAPSGAPASPVTGTAATTIDPPPQVAGGNPSESDPSVPVLLGEVRRIEFEVYVELRALKGGARGGA